MRGLPEVVHAIAKNVSRIIAERQISGRKLAQLARQPVMTINDMLNGRRIPGIDVVEAVADALGVGIDDLRKRPERKSRKSA